MDEERLLAAVLEPRRRRLLQLLAEGPRPVGVLARRFDVTRPAISQHLAVLREAGLVELDERPGHRAYGLLPAGLEAARAALTALAAELPQDPGPAPVVVELHVAATAEAVFALLTELDQIARWLGTAAEVEAHPGGRLRVDLGGGDVAVGSFELVEPPSRVAFTWGQEGDGEGMGPGATRVDVAVTPVDGEGAVACRVRLEHRGLPPELQGPRLASWARHLAALAEVAGGDAASTRR
jgi:uncharacterized protein YndB with AHSA1/START domain/biotin operon repressor